MKTGIKAAVAAVLASATLFTGCVTSPVTYVPSSEPVEPGQYTVLGDEVEGSSSEFVLLCFGLGDSAQRKAFRDALKNAPPETDALIGMSVEREAMWLIALNFLRTRVSGTPVKVIRK